MAEPVQRAKPASFEGDDGMTQYARMQKSHYDKNGISPETLVGNYEYHENFPYETFLLHKYGDVRRPLFSSYAGKKAFDIACGEGRMIRRMKSFFPTVDGADISEVMVKAARERCSGSTIYLTDGMRCGDAASGAYDFVYCTISLHHICVHETRAKIIKDCARILKPGGKITLQMMFSKHFPYTPHSVGSATMDGHDVLCAIYAKTGKQSAWFANDYDAVTTNGGHDVLFGEDDIAAVKNDFLTVFNECDMGFFDICIGQRGDPRILPTTHPNSHAGYLHHGTHFVFIYCDGPRVG